MRKIWSIIFVILMVLSLGVSLIACGQDDSQKIQDVVDAIVALPDDLTVDDIATVDSVKALYDALSAKSQAKVSNYAFLEEALNKISDIKAAEAIKASHVEETITALPGVISINDVARVEEARAQYNALSSYAKTLVSNYATLTSAEAQVDALPAADKAAYKVTALINALPSEITSSDLDAVMEASDLYDALSATAKELVTNYSVLENALDVLKDDIQTAYAQAKVVADLIERLPETVSSVYSDYVKDALAQYNALGGYAKSCVYNYETLVSYSQALENYKPTSKTEEFVDMVNALPTAAKIKYTDYAVTQKAMSFYDSLTEDEKTTVADDYAILKTLNSKAYTAYLEHEEELKKAEYERIANGVRDIILPQLPDTTSSDLTLPSYAIFEDKAYQITWLTSDVYTINTDGTIYQGYEDVKVTLSFVVKVETTVRRTFTKDITVTAMQSTPVTSGKVLMAYLYDGNYYKVQNKDNKVLDVINYGFATINSDSTITVALAHLSEVMALRKAGTKIVLSLGGGGSESLKNWSDAASTALNRKTFAQSCLDAIKTYHFDGIDFDWEYPGYNTGRTTDVDRPNFTEMVKAVSQTLKAYDSNLIISAAVPGGPYGYPRYEISKLNQYMDFFNLMTYDMQGSSTATHHTALYQGSGVISQCSIEESVKIWNSNGADMSKIVIGAAFYGHKFTVSSSSNNGLGQKNTLDSSPTITYTNILQTYLNKATCKEYYDSKTGAAYCFDSDSMTFISYDNKDSLSAKCDYVNTKGIRGLMFWDYGSDRTDTLMSVLRSKRSSLV